MDSTTVNISFKKDILELIDHVAKEESRTRSDLIKEAAHMYIERKNRWNMIFDYGQRRAAESSLIWLFLDRSSDRHSSLQRC